MSHYSWMDIPEPPLITEEKIKAHYKILLASYNTLQEDMEALAEEYLDEFHKYSLTEINEVTLNDEDANDLTISVRFNVDFGNGRGGWGEDYEYIPIRYLWTPGWIEIQRKEDLVESMEHARLCAADREKQKLEDEKNELGLYHQLKLKYEGGEK